MIQIDHIQENIKTGFFIASENAVEMGRITYVMAETKLTIEHTIVNPKYEGRGLGTKLVFAVVEYARANNLKIVPVCTFAEAVFDKTPEIQDVLFS